MNTYVVVGMSPVGGEGVVAGPYSSGDQALAVAEEMEHRGWDCEVMECVTLDDIPTVVNEEK